MSAEGFDVHMQADVAPPSPFVRHHVNTPGRSSARDHRRRSTAARRHGLLHRAARAPTNEAAWLASLSWESSSPPSTPAPSTSPQPPRPAAVSIDQARAAVVHLPADHFPPCWTPPPAPSTTATPSPCYHRHRPGRRQRLHRPLPQAAAHYFHRTGPAPRTGPARAGSRLSRPVPGTHHRASAAPRRHPA